MIVHIAITASIYLKYRITIDKSQLGLEIKQCRIGELTETRHSLCLACQQPDWGAASTAARFGLEQGLTRCHMKYEGSVVLVETM